MREGILVRVSRGGRDPGNPRKTAPEVKGALRNRARRDRGEPEEVVRREKVRVKEKRAQKEIARPVFGIARLNIRRIANGHGDVNENLLRRLSAGKSLA